MESLKKLLSFIGREIARSIVFGTFLVLFIAWAVYALSYPSTPPSGEVAGGKFMQYFNSIRVSCPVGQYLNGYDVNFNKLCATAPAGANGATGPQGPAGANGTDGAQWPQGPVGANGAQWPQWPQGPAGTPGAAWGNGGVYNTCNIISTSCLVNPRTGWYSCPPWYTAYRAAANSIGGDIYICL